MNADGREALRADLPEDLYELAHFRDVPQTAAAQAPHRAAIAARVEDYAAGDRTPRRPR